MWAGRFKAALDKEADDFNSSIHFDSRMWREDITGSIAHAKMLSKCGIISDADRDAIIAGLEAIYAELEAGTMAIDTDCEDIHMFVEKVLTERIGDAGKRLHTARSRNDQVALDLRMYMRTAAAEVRELATALCRTLTDKAEEYRDTIMPGYTHLQRAQPITFGHHLMAYAMMLLRDIGRIKDAEARLDASPIGCCALAGTTYATDRRFEAELLGFSEICMNSLDGVSDRDFALELMSAFSVMMMHLSRLSEEIILWSSWEFGFVELSDSFTTGSSIMPQKKNSDIAELVRGKTGRVYGDLMSLLTAMKGLPLAYNKDMQEDKEAIFDATDTVKKCLSVFAPMIETMKAKPEAMARAAKRGFINATDLADYMVGKGIPFRTAYKITGELVAYCIDKDCVLEDLTIDEFRKFSDTLDEGLYEAIDLRACVDRRQSEGGTAPVCVDAQIEWVRAKLAQ